MNWIMESLSIMKEEDLIDLKKKSMSGCGEAKNILDVIKKVIKAGSKVPRTQSFSLFF